METGLERPAVPPPAGQMMRCFPRVAKFGSRFVI